MKPEYKCWYHADKHAPGAICTERGSTERRDTMKKKILPDYPDSFHEALREQVMTLTAERDRYKAQNADLLAALKAALPTIDNCEKGIRNIVKAAIAQAEQTPCTKRTKLNFTVKINGNWKRL